MITEKYSDEQIKDCLVSVVNDICVGSKSANRESILKYESIAKTMPQLEIPVIHRIHGGMYAREITIPAGAILTGHIYKFDHFDVMISGDITVSTDTGETKRFTGYNCFNGMSGKKRAGYAHEDTTWITFHPFSGNDGDEIQKFITAQTFEELEIFHDLVNRQDYKEFIESILMTEEEVRKQVENNDDLIDMPIGFDHIIVKESRIEGKGLFSKTDILNGEIICPSRIKSKRNPAGRYTNHARQPNAKMMFTKHGDINLMAIRDIESLEEITVNYRDVIRDRATRGDLCQE